jgi:fumarylpyruvate hydrolase
MDLPIVIAPTIAIAGSDDRFPVRRIFCVGRNYADHAREMGSDPVREPPFFFAKPADAVTAGGLLTFPVQTTNLHHEVELVLALGAGGTNIDPSHAEDLIFGYAVGIDLTRRDLQDVAKKGARPWDMAKGFDESAPIGPLTRGAPPTSGAITLTVNGDLRQSGDIADMIWSMPEIISILSTYVALAPGDLIFTGTPAGVGPIRPGDAVIGIIDGLEPIEIRYEA